MKIFDIHPNNSKQKPFDFLLIENFAPIIQDSNVYQEYIKNYSVTNGYPEMDSISPHPVEKELQENKFAIINRVNKMWDLNITDIYISMNSFNKKGHGLTLHNDFHEVDRIPVRGILYCNPNKKFGTNIHGESTEEIGGGPGDLLLIKVSEKSWHSTVTIEEDTNDRITCNMFFVNEIKEDTNFSVNE